MIENPIKQKAVPTGTPIAAGCKALVFSAPSGAGKTTLVRQLMAERDALQKKLEAAELSRKNQLKAELLSTVSASGEINRIIGDLGKKQNRLRDLVHFVVKSDLFLNK